MNNNNLQDSGVKLLCIGLKNIICKLEILSLSMCDLTEESCSALASVLSSDSSSLKDLDLSNNNLQDSGVKLLSDGLNEKCNLEKLRLSNCIITEEGYKALASALRSNPSHLIELDLTGNDPGQSGVKELNDLLQDPNCQLKTLRLCGCKITEKQLLILTSALKSNLSHLRELNLSGNKLKDSGAKNLSDLMMNPQCKVEKLELCGCRVTEKQCLILTSALKSNPSHLRELDLSENKIKNTGVKHLCDVLKDPDCKLERLSLHDCGITDVYSLIQTLTNTKALQFLKELDLSYNMIGDSKQQLIDVLQGSNCKLLEKEHWLTASLSNINLS
uniref:Uncharacterized protein n=1 Tax=Cyprinus carpio TaxID=7962 RepID=A0A8C1TBK4_CYPCA